MIEQLSFDLDDRLTVGDAVEVIARPHDGQDVETFYYLQEFAGKKGVLKRIDKRKKVSFEVEFPKGRDGIFYENEIRKTGALQ